jgi:hypothetical protein
VACQTLGVTVEPHLADWKGLGNIAGPTRNREMVESGADLCIALHRSIETSKGTRDCVRQAAKSFPTRAAITAWLQWSAELVDSADLMSKRRSAPRHKQRYRDRCRGEHDAQHSENYHADCSRFSL